MKTIFLALLFSPLLGFGQTTEYADCAQPTKSRDTLYLLENDPLSKTTFNVWKNDPTWNGTCPTIIWVNQIQLTALKNKSVATVRDSKISTASAN